MVSGHVGPRRGEAEGLLVPSLWSDFLCFCVDTALAVLIHSGQIVFPFFYLAISLDVYSCPALSFVLFF